MALLLPEFLSSFFVPDSYLRLCFLHTHVLQVLPISFSYTCTVPFCFIYISVLVSYWGAFTRGCFYAHAGAPCINFHFSFYTVLHFTEISAHPNLKTTLLLGSENRWKVICIGMWTLVLLPPRQPRYLCFAFFCCFLWRVVLLISEFPFLRCLVFVLTAFSCVYTMQTYARAHIHTRKRMQYGTNVCKTMEASPSFIRHKSFTLRLSSSQDTTRGIKKEKGRSKGTVRSDSSCFISTTNLYSLWLWMLSVRTKLSVAFL